MSGSDRFPPRNSSFRSGMSTPDTNSRLSFMLNSSSDANRASSGSHKIAFLFNSSSDPDPDSNDAFAHNTSGSHARDALSHIERDPFSHSKQESDVTSSSFVTFAMSRSGLQQDSREMLAVHKPRISFMGSFVSYSIEDSDEDLDAWNVEPIHRLAPHRDSTKGSVSKQIKKYIDQFNVPKEKLLQVKDSMLNAMEKGLKQNVKEDSSLPMLSSYVCTLPDGTERGDILGVELCRTHVKVLLLQLTDDVNEPEVVRKRSFPISDKVLNGNGEQVFEFVAQCLDTFLSGLNFSKKYFPLGFSFPFPCEHITLNQCKLIKWTKDNRWPDGVGRDVTELLQTAINQQCKNYEIEVLAVVNNTVGTLLSANSEAEPCEVGLVVDVGTNCCYIEEMQRIAGLGKSEGRICINTEWGSVGNAGELNHLLTEFDLLMDKQTLEQGKYRFEKLVGSMYVCETIRMILANLAEKGEIFNGVLTPTLLTKGKVLLQDVVEIIDEKVGLAKAKNFLDHMGMVASNQDCFHVQQICQAIFTRSAKLCAAGLAGILTHIRNAQGLPALKIVVAVEGELYKSQIQYGEILQETLKSLVPECTVKFVKAENGSCYGAALVAAVQVRLKQQRETVDKILTPFQLSMVELEKLRNTMRQDMEKGLSKETHGKSALKMLPAFVRSLPDGSERGDFLAVDLGGTNFRVLMVQVRSQEEGGVRMISETYTIPPEIAQSNATELFDHIVGCILDFHNKHSILGRALPLGFTFSFPCDQVNLDKGILMRWTKGFSAVGCVGEDVVALMRQAMQRKPNIDVDVVALVNDTVGTMMACAYADPKCEVGLIVGTGTNTCYMEEMRNIGFLEGDEGRMCINMEWGAFGDDGSIDSYMTSYDRKVDAESINKGQQRYEKLISGMYLGEIVRYILLDLASNKKLFKGRESHVLKTKDIFPTKFLTDVEDSEGHQNVCNILEGLGLTVTLEDGLVVKEVCHTISSRAAKICAAGVAAVVDKIRENKRMTKLDVTVGVDGTLYKLHHFFAKKLQDTVALLAPNCNVKFMLSEDGSGKGAALIASVACHK